jgi:hypothetical protein
MLRGLNVECLAVREICSIVHDVARALGLETGSRLAMRSSKRPTLRLLNKAARPLGRNMWRSSWTTQRRA